MKTLATLLMMCALARAQTVIRLATPAPEGTSWAREGALSLVDTSVNVYQNRGFKHLMVSFGCTGGQHRSVYFAEQLAKHFNGRPGLNVVLRHLGLEQHIMAVGVSPWAAAIRRRCRPTAAPTRSRSTSRGGSAGSSGIGPG